MHFEALKLRQEFKKLLNTGTKIALKTFVLFYIPNELNCIRAGFIAARKSFPTAVLRNRARRRLRGLIREFTKSTHFNGFDLVVIARTQCLNERFLNMAKEMENILTRMVAK